MMGFYYYEKTSPRPVQDGIRTKSRKGSIGEKWWSKKFLDALNQMGMESRLARGRTYARKGQVMSLAIRDGAVHAKVQGSSPRPYNVRIETQKWDPRQWDHVFDEISSQAIYSAQLLAGEMPPDIDDLVQMSGLSLFPKGKDLQTSCSCPDYANPCKHIAAVYYILAERFDEDPFLLFEMRGRTKEQILEGLNVRRAVEEPDPSLLSSPPTPGIEPEDLKVPGFFSFRSPVEEFRVYPGTTPTVKGMILKKLSDSPFEAGKKNFKELLVPFYETAPVYIRRMIYGDEPDKQKD